MGWGGGGPGFEQISVRHYIKFVALQLAQWLLRIEMLEIAILWESWVKNQMTLTSCTSSSSYINKDNKIDKFIVVVLLFNVHGKHLRSCQDGQLT